MGSIETYQGKPAPVTILTRLIPAVLLAGTALSAQQATAQQTPSYSATTERSTAELPAAAASAPNFASAMALIAAGRWDAASAAIDAMPDRELAAFARAELYVAAGSPTVTGPQLLALINEAPTLPQAEQLARLAQRRGVTSLPQLPAAQRLAWAGSSPRRGNPRAVSDPAAGLIRTSIQERIRADDPAGAEAILTGVETNLSPEALTEWRQRVAWSYYIENDVPNARRVAALAQQGSGDWVAHADWAAGLAAWRDNDCRAAMAAFRNVAGRATEPEIEASGHFWYARAATRCGEAHEAAPALRRAAALDETFYGLLAAEALGIRTQRRADNREAEERRLTRNANVRAAIELAAIGNLDLAGEALRHQARIGPASDHAALAMLAGSLGLPETQLFLAHNAPRGARPDAPARFPAPRWMPAGGWRISPALVYAHTLQESQFRQNVVSPAGAIGLMQLMPGTARMMGLGAMGSRLTDPATNLELGQAYIEHLRDSTATGGALPKVIAAYNAGPTPVERWNVEIQDGGDPLLWIESIPYWETRAYVGTVLRNLWIYENEMGVAGDSRRELAQGRWPRVPAAPQAAQVASLSSPVFAARR
jgi:soluble lytic murein transglycosylase-like protein